MGTRVSVYQLLFCLLLCGVCRGQAKTLLPEPYTDEDAYKIYSLLLPHQESYGFSKGMIVISMETVVDTGDQVGQGCLAPAAEEKFKEAVKNFHEKNSKRWILQRKFESKKPYVLMKRDDIKETSPVQFWKAFYERYPNSGGYHVFSAVGFNADKTRAVVYSGSGCGSLCGFWSPSLFEKVNGEWKSVPGIQCYTVS